MFNLPVTFKVNYGPATVNSVGVVTLDGLEGNVSITASQSGSAYVNPAPDVTQVFYVSSKQGRKLDFLNLVNQVDCVRHQRLPTFGPPRSSFYKRTPS